MMKRLKNSIALGIAICWTFALLAQQNNIPLNPFYKDRLYYSTSKMEGYTGNSFFPVSEGQYDLHTKIQDTSKQYYLVTEHLFKKHFLEFKGKNYYLTISPVFDVSMGKDFADTVKRWLFQNTKGFHIEGDLFKNFSFSTSFYENQSRNPIYQKNYFNAIGESYVKTSDSTYFTQNAVVPGLGRTKPFKVDGFDYAFAMGEIIYRPFKVLTLSAGNTRKFVGDGYRSLLLSDNSFSAPFFQANYRFHPRWEFVYMRSKLLNMLRRPASTTVESYYDPKILAVNYLSFKATKTLTISLFEGTIYSKGDSVVSKHASPWMYNPIPGLGAFVVKEKEANSILGLNIGYTIVSELRMYAQVAWNPRHKGYGAQLGFRISEPGHVKNLFLQLEGNYASTNLYRSSNPRLNYSHFNLPLAHTKGEGFAEIILRANYEIKRVYFDVKAIYYNVDKYSPTSHLALYDKGSLHYGSTFYTSVETGYRFNKKMNFSVFINYLFRKDNTASPQLTNVFGIGMRTGLINSYTDF
ncbi:MAG TPA: hypothetical protein PKN22_00440 [Taishania sp.]|nr:hypothetical protein [Taishania sp.]